MLERRVTEGSVLLRASYWRPAPGAGMQFSIQAHDFGYKLLRLCEINVSTLDIRAQQLHPQLVPNIHALLPVR